MFRLATLRAALVTAAFIVAAAADAAPAVFTVTGPTALESFSFTVVADPVPGESSAHDFTLFDVPSYGDLGFGPVDYLANYTFYDTSLGGGFSGGYLLNVYSGSPLFDGTTGAPHFTSGTARLTDYFGQATLVHAAVPEPTTWLLMVAGFGITGAMLRRRAAIAV